MRATIHFNLANEEDRYDFEVFSLRTKLINVLSGYLSELRKKIKYTEETGSWHEARELLTSLIEDEELNIGNLM